MIVKIKHDVDVYIKCPFRLTETVVIALFYNSTIALRFFMQKQPPEVLCKKGGLKNFANFFNKVYKKKKALY